jgi:hypothetical protein
VLDGAGGTSPAASHSAVLTVTRSVPLRRHIRRQLTEGAVRASDRRALLVGAEAYQAAGSVIVRDLFEDNDGGWLRDPALLDSLVSEKLEREAECISAEGWKWILVGVDFPYSHTSGLRRLTGKTAPLIGQEYATPRSPGPARSSASIAMVSSSSSGACSAPRTKR